MTVEEYANETYEWYEDAYEDYSSLDDAEDYEPYKFSFKEWANNFITEYNIKVACLGNYKAVYSTFLVP